MYVPRQYQFLDLPDVAALNAPRPLLIQNAKQDKLFNLEGMKAAEQKLAEIYLKMDAPNMFKCTSMTSPIPWG